MEETVKAIKKRCYAMRNGIVADNLRQSGAPYRMIFGVNLPHLTEIAREYPKSLPLAQALWDDRTTRESLLLATMLCPPDDMDEERARIWASEVPSAEIADLLCHRLLRHCDFAWSMARGLVNSPGAMQRYTGLRLMFNLLPTNVEEVRGYALREAERELHETYMLSRALIDETSFIMGVEE